MKRACAFFRAKGHQADPVFRPGREDKEYAQGVESIADEVLNGAVIASARVQQLLVCAVDGTLAPAVLEEK